jgi:hypothetical protein
MVDKKSNGKERESEQERKRNGASALVCEKGKKGK